MSIVAADLRKCASQIATVFREEIPGVEAVCLFGSVARGDASADSDIDLLVVGRDPELTPTVLLRSLPPELRDIDISLLYYAEEALDRLAREGASFLTHIQHEGEILFDHSGILTEALQWPIDHRRVAGDELRVELERLRPYSNLKRFNGNFLFVLAQLFAIGRAVVILALTKDGVFEFRRTEALEEYLKRRPDLREEIQIIQSLEPFYELVVKRKERELPFPFKESEPQVAHALRAVRRVAARELTDAKRAR